MVQMGLGGRASLGLANVTATFNITKAEPKLGLGEPEEDDHRIFELTSMGVARRPVSEVTLLMGRRGRGKTLGMTWYAASRDRYYKRHGFPNKIAANYWMEHADYVRPDLVEWLMGYPDAGHDMFICLDELGTIVSNRRSLSRANLDFGNFLGQVRKRRNSVMSTTQFPQWIDKMTLYQIDLFMLMESHANNSRIKVYVWDWFGQFTGDMRIKRWPPAQEDVDLIFWMLNTDKMFPKYLSDQVIAPSWSQNKDQIVKGQFGADWEEMYEYPELDLTVTREVHEEMTLAPPKSFKELLEREAEKREDVFRIDTWMPREVQRLGFVEHKGTLNPRQLAEAINAIPGWEARRNGYSWEAKGPGHEWHLAEG